MDINQDSCATSVRTKSKYRCDLFSKRRPSHLDQNHARKTVLASICQNRPPNPTLSKTRRTLRRKGYRGTTNARRPRAKHHGSCLFIAKATAAERKRQFQWLWQWHPHSLSKPPAGRDAPALFCKRVFKGVTQHVQNTHATQREVSSACDHALLFIA